MSLLPILLSLLAAPQQTDPLDVPLRGEGRSSSSARHDSAKRLAQSTLEFELQAASHDPLLAWHFGIRPSGAMRENDSAIWTRFLNQQSNYLENLWTPDLSDLERSERDALAARLRMESILSSALPRQRWDPVFYVERAEILVDSAASGTSEERAKALLGIKAVFKPAGRLLVNPRSGWMEEAIVRLTGLRLRLSGLPNSDETQVALDACDAFADWVRDAARRYGDPIPRLGHLNWEALMQACSGTTMNTTQLRVRLLREIARLDTMLQGYAGPKPPEIELEQVVSKAEAMTRFARNEGRRGKVIPPLIYEVTVETVKGHAFPSKAISSFQIEGKTRIFVTTPSDYWPESLRNAYTQELDPNVVSAAAIRYGMPGEGHLNGAARAEGSVNPLRWNRSTVEGWGLYVLDWLPRHPDSSPAFSRQKNLRPEMIRAQLIETARLLATLEWHTQRLAEGVIAQQLAGRTGLESAITQLEVRRATHDPLYGIGALGALELRDSERLLERTVNPPDAVKMLTELILTRPDLRPGDLKAHGHLNGSG